MTVNSHVHVLVHADVIFPINDLYVKCTFMSISYFHLFFNVYIWRHIICLFLLILIQVDPYMKDPKQRVLYDMLERLLKAQEESIATVRLSEQEVQQLLFYTMVE